MALPPLTSCAVSSSSGVGVLTEKMGSKSNLDLKQDKKVNLRILIVVFLDE